MLKDIILKNLLIIIIIFNKNEHVKDGIKKLKKIINWNIESISWLNPNMSDLAGGSL
jgi:hypothetical protein